MSRNAAAEIDSAIAFCRRWGLNGIFIGIFAVQKIMSFYIIFKIREKNMLAIKNDL